MLETVIVNTVTVPNLNYNLEDLISNIQKLLNFSKPLIMIGKFSNPHFPTGISNKYVHISKSL